MAAPQMHVRGGRVVVVVVPRGGGGGGGGGRPQQEASPADARVAPEAITGV